MVILGRTSAVTIDLSEYRMTALPLASPAHKHRTARKRTEGPSGRAAVINNRCAIRSNPDRAVPAILNVA